MPRVCALLLPFAASLFFSVAAQEKGGTVRFTEKLLQKDYGYAFCVSANDLDGDGHLDLVSSDTTKNLLFWFAGDGKGNFDKHFISESEPGWLERHSVGDIDGDGKPDIAIVKNLVGELIWYKNPGKPRETKAWKKHVITTKFMRSYDILLIDLDGDSKLDAAATGWNGNQAAVFRNSGTPEDGKEWQKNVIDANIGESRTVRPCDFNGDGKPDLLVTGRGANLVVWYENPGKPFAMPWKRHVIDDKVVSPCHGHAIDMNGDGKLDVVMASGFISGAGAGLIGWYENPGSPANEKPWKRHVIGKLPSAFEAFAADLNGDGHKDIVATAWGEPGALVWFENPGDPTQASWKMHTLKTPWHRANQVIVADLDKDGRPDIIAVAERGANELRWWRNEGR